MARFLNLKSSNAINAKSIKTESLILKLSNGYYVNFTLPDLGSAYQVLQTDGSGKFNWAENNNNISTVYYLKNDTDILFNDELNISDYFELLRTGNFKLDNNTNKKVLLKIGLIYKWIGLPQDYDLKVYVDDVEEYSNREGLSDYSDIWNKLNDEIIIDITKGTLIKLILKKPNDNSTFIIKKNSFYSIELL